MPGRQDADNLGGAALRSVPSAWTSGNTGHAKVRLALK